jgi:lysozyme family protein
VSDPTVLMAAYTRWCDRKALAKLAGPTSFADFAAGWHARDEEIAQLRAIAERGATDLDLAAETLLAHLEMDRAVFIGTLQRQAQHIRNALAANVPVSETWKEGRS